MTAARMYEEMCAFLGLNGWRRTAPGDGWWHSLDGDEATIGEACERELEAQGIDTRNEP